MTPYTLGDKMNTSNQLTIRKALLWLGGYFCVMLLYTAIDIILWKKIESPLSAWLNLASMLIFTILFIKVLAEKNAWRISLKSDASAKGIILALCCAVLFYFLLDKCLDPFFEGLFPASQDAYQDSLLSLAETPVPAFIHVCLLAPVTEEILMRGFALDGLKRTYGSGTALLVSSLLFALLHFNMVQTLSAFICGLILGILYLRTGSVLCCMLAHGGYNLISFFTAVMPLLDRVKYL